MKLEKNILYRVVEGTDVKQTKTIPLIRVKGQPITFKIGVSEEFETQPTSLSELDTTDEINNVGFYNSTSLMLINYLGFEGDGVVVVKGLSLKPLNQE